ncbi:MAG: 50S ribosomal protein L10 [Actinomycetota bacterium]
MENQRSGEPRADKVAIVTEVKERLEQSSAVMVTEYRGLTVKELAELRNSLRPLGGAYKVYKNSLVRRAADDAGVDLSEHLVGPTALAFTEQTPEGEPGDVVTVAKVLRDFAKTNPALLIKGGYFDGQPIDADGVKALADVEPREVLLAKLAGLMAAPMQQMAGLLQALPRDFAYGLKALIDEGGAPGAPAASADEAAPAADAEAANDDAADAPSEDATADEAPAEESAPEAEAPAEAEAEAEASTDETPEAE